MNRHFRIVINRYPVYSSFSIEFVSINHKSQNSRMNHQVFLGGIPKLRERTETFGASQSQQNLCKLPGLPDNLLGPWAISGNSHVELIRCDGRLIDGHFY